MENKTGSHSYNAYDNLLERRHSIDGANYTTSYDYDKEDKIAKQPLPSRRVVEYSRSNVCQMSEISIEVNGQKQAIVSEISCRADGKRTGYLYGGLSRQRAYNLTVKAGLGCIKKVTELKIAKDSMFRWIYESLAQLKRIYGYQLAQLNGGYAASSAGATGIPSYTGTLNLQSGQTTIL